MVLIVLPLLIVYAIAAFTIIVLLFQRRRVKWGVSVAIIAFLIPAGDVIIGKAYFTFLCLTQAGDDISKTVRDVKGVVVEGTFKEPKSVLKTPEKREGYEFIETQTSYRHASGRREDAFVRISWSDEVGGFEKVPITGPAQQFAIGWWDSQDSLQRLLNIWRREFRVHDQLTDVQFAHLVRFWWRGGWLENIAVDAPSATAVSCPKRDLLGDIRILQDQILVPESSVKGEQ